MANAVYWIDQSPLAGGEVLSLHFPLPLHGLPFVIVPVTSKWICRDPPAVPVAVKLTVGAVAEPATFPVASAVSITPPVAVEGVLDAVHFTSPFAVPLRVASVGGLGGDFHVVPPTTICPITFAVIGPQSPI